MAILNCSASFNSMAVAIRGTSIGGSIPNSSGKDNVPWLLIQRLIAIRRLPGRGDLEWPHPQKSETALRSLLLRHTSRGLQEASERRRSPEYSQRRSWATSLPDRIDQDSLRRELLKRRSVSDHDFRVSITAANRPARTETVHRTRMTPCLCCRSLMLMWRAVRPKLIHRPVT
jgi:hypothetical protein